MKTFMFTWYENEKYGNRIKRHNLIQVTAGPDIGASAKRATDVFCKNFGNLKQNTIISIQEMANGKPIGEPIVPQEDTSIIPIKK